ncbi:hypothetical protein BD324DRAFT_296794 [Kockovaella imperatae]|uniref:NAD(P)-binding protein n=1 Tax=Kockovaella imperatae TaxID=4999 RepID=A0A1Y1ULH0_9TREE|nr:hypothetical protein BD324DRAFT_296794 [Kockovaella imperatae]ORX38890.1 hypothetical protein BD324DRAFT_296794 [Kockovaella imperatae]
MSTTVLISGANRGLGFGLVERYAARDSYTVIATARNPSSMPVVKTGNGSQLIVVEMDQAQVDGPEKMIEQVKSKGISKLDLVICNAAIMTNESFAKIRDIDPKVFEEHWRVNATVRLMEKDGKFIFMSSGAAILDREAEASKPDVTYGITKAGANFLARMAHFEEPHLVIFALSPGWVQTDMGNRAAVLSGREGGKAVISVAESCDGMVKVIDDATRDSMGGKHMRYDSTVSKW